MWGSLASCAPVAYRRNWRVGNPPQVGNLPHINMSTSLPTLPDYDGFIAFRMRRLAGKASPRQTRNTFRLQRGGKGRRAVSAPGDTAIRQGNTVRVAHTNPWCGVRLDTVVRRGRPVIENATGIFGPAVEGDGHFVQCDVGDPALRRAVDPYAVFGAPDDVAHAHIVDRADFAALGARNGGEGDGLAAAPPGRRLVAGNKLDVAEIDPVHTAFVAQLDRQPAAARLDLAALETDIVDVLGGFRSDLQPRILGLDHAVLHRDVSRSAPLLILPRRLDHDGIVAAHDVAVTDLHVAAMVRVDAVAVGHIQIVADLEAVHQDMLAPQHVEPPLRRLAEGDVANLQSLAAGEDKHLRAECAELPDLALLVEPRHELGGAARDIAGSGDLQVARAVRREHAIFVARRIVRGVRGNHQFGIVG